MISFILSLFFNSMNRLIFLSQKKHRPTQNQTQIDIQYNIEDIDEYLSTQYSLNTIIQFNECCSKIVQLCQQKPQQPILMSQAFENFIQNCIEVVEQIIQHDQIEYNEKTFSLIIDIIRKTVVYHQDTFIKLIIALLNVLELSVGIYSNVRLEIASELISFIDQLTSYNHIYQECIEPEFERKVLFQALQTIEDVTKQQNQWQNYIINDHINNQNGQYYDFQQQISQTKIISTCCKAVTVITNIYSFSKKYYSLCDRQMIASLQIVIQVIINNYYQNQDTDHMNNRYNYPQGNMKLNIKHEEAIDMLCFITKITSIIIENGTTNSLLQLNYYSLIVIISQNIIEYVNILSQLITMVLTLRDYFIFNQEDILKIYFDNYFEKYFIQFNITTGYSVPKVYVSVLQLFNQILKDQNENEVLDDIIQKPQYIKIICQSIMSNHQIIARCSIDIFITIFNNFTKKETLLNNVYTYIEIFRNANLFVMLHNKMRLLGQQNLENEQMYHILHLLQDICQYNRSILIENEFIDTFIQLLEDYADQKCVDLIQDLLTQMQSEFPQYFE